MNKNLQIIINLIRWIFGIGFSIISLGGFASGTFISASIILIIGLFLIPPSGNWLLRLISGKTNFDNSSLGFFSSNSRRILKKIDLNDNNVISIIDNQIKSSEKKVSDKEQKNLGKQLYKQTLTTYLNDLHLSELEKAKLQDIINYFNLSTIEVSQIKNSLNKKAIESLVKKSYDDKVLTNAEQNEIMELAQYLELPLNIVESFKSKIISTLLKVAFNEKLNDKKLSPTEETELLKLLNDLQIDKNRISEFIPQNSLRQLAYAKLLWSLDNGIFFSIPNPQITLRKNEECYLSNQAQLLESKIVNKGYSYASSGISIPITKGVRFRTSSGRSKPIKEEVKVKYSGTLFLTNLRIVFSTSGNKSFQIPFSKLLSFNVYSDGLEFILEKKNYLLRLPSSEIELFATGLTSSIRNYLNSDNEKVTSAMKEIENNDSFIDL